MEDIVKGAIDGSYKAHINALYKALSVALLAAKGDDQAVAAAESAFTRGLSFSADVRVRALAAAGLS